MNYKKFLVFLLFCCSWNGAFCQESKDDVTYFISKIKNNYAGFKDKVKGNQFDVFVKKVLKEDGTDTFRILSRIANYFNDNHVVLYDMHALEARAGDTLAAPRTLTEVMDYLSNAKVKTDRYEGFWLNDYNSTVLGIVRDKNKPGHYKMYLIETRYTILPVGTLVGELEPDGKNGYFTRYLTSGGGYSTYVTTHFRNDSVFTLGQFSKFRKRKNYIHSKPLLPTLTHVSLENSGKSLDKDNYLLTIPDFAYNLGSIDSIVKADSAKIYAAKNLILDLRDNGGGRVRAYEAIFPLVYTGPIKPVRGTILASDDLVAEYKDDLQQTLQKKPVDSAEVRQLQADIAKFEKGKGGFVSDDDQPDKTGPMLPLPQNIGIITNYACQSAAEMMVLNFKQSRKVTVFGENTFGAVDYLNATSIYTPSKRYYFSFATAKRTIPAAEHRIDGKGIAPDVRISDSVADWIDFVVNYYRDGKRKSKN